MLEMAGSRRRPLGPAFGLVAMALALLWAPASARAGVCDDVFEYPGKRAKWHHGRSPLVIGDSTMIFAAPMLAKQGFHSNARGCRAYFQANDEILRRLKRAGTLPDMVIMNLGANGNVTRPDIMETLHILGANRVLVLLTPIELGGGGGSDAQLIRDMGRRRPNRIKVLDWVRYSAPHGSWFAGDGLHLSVHGAEELTRYILRTKQWLPGNEIECTVDTAKRALGDPTLVPVTPLCGDFAGDARPDMIVPIDSGGSMGVYEWRMYRPRGRSSWRLAYSDDGSVLAKYPTAGGFNFFALGEHDVKLTARAHSDSCNACARYFWEFRLHWDGDAFAVAKATKVPIGD